jgi:hypothetical protein
MLTLLPKGVIIKSFLIKVFFHLPPVSVVHNELQTPKKFETTLMGYSGAWGKLIHKKA